MSPEHKKRVPTYKRCKSGSALHVLGQQKRYYQFVVAAPGIGTLIIENDTWPQEPDPALYSLVEAVRDLLLLGDKRIDKILESRSIRFEEE